MTKWHLFICSDCDTDEGVLIHQVDDVGAGCNIDFCPGCDNYLGMTDMGEVTVSGHRLTSLLGREPAQG